MAAANDISILKDAGFCGAGVSPVTFLIATPHKTAGGTPAPQFIANSVHRIVRLPNSLFGNSNAGKK